MHRTLIGITALAAIAGLYWNHLRIDAADAPAYQNLIQESAALKAYNALEEAPVRQRRSGVRKDIWTPQGSERLHSRIVSARSELTLIQQKEKAEAVELLHEIEGWFDGIEIRHLTAESGEWEFAACRMTACHLALDLEGARCIAEEARISKNTVELLGPFHIDHAAGRLSGQSGSIAQEDGCRKIQLEDGVLFEAAQAPFSIASMRASTELPMNGFANSQEVYFHDGVEIKTVSGIQAHGESAIVCPQSLTLLPDPGSFCSLTQNNDRIDAKEIRFDVEAHELLCLYPSGLLEAKKSHFDADSGRIQFETKALRPETLILEGNVRISSHLHEKKSFAMADSAICNILEKKMILDSAPGSRVLFRQQGLDISAPTVHIRNAVQAFGDVRCFFYPEEKRSIDSIFSRRL